MFSIRIKFMKNDYISSQLYIVSLGQVSKTVQCFITEEQKYPSLKLIVQERSYNALELKTPSCFPISPISILERNSVEHAEVKIPHLWERR